MGLQIPVISFAGLAAFVWFFGRTDTITHVLGFQLYRVSGRTFPVKRSREIEHSAQRRPDERRFFIHHQLEPNQPAFSAEQYGAEFKRVVETADKFGNAVIAIRGHSDPTKTLLDL